MESPALAALVDFGAANDVDAIVITRHGRIVAEAYYAPFRKGMQHRLNSATKAVVSALVGIAIGQGKIADTNQPVLPFFLDHPIANLDDRKKSMTIQHLLDMTSGINWTEPLSNNRPDTWLALQRSPDWVQFVLDQPMAERPGTTFNYSGGNTQLLSAIITLQTAMSTADFAMQYLFKPLGVTDFEWQTDPQGVSKGGHGLFMQPRDMAKIGYLYLRGGEWDGQQIIPKAWVDKIYQAKVPMKISASVDWRYADQWWTLPEQKAYMAVGFNRQLILILPQADVVLALTGRKNYSFKALLDLIASAVKSAEPLPPNAPGAALLAQKTTEASRTSTGDLK